MHQGFHYIDKETFRKILFSRLPSYCINVADSNASAFTQHAPLLILEYLLSLPFPKLYLSLKIQRTP